MIASLPTCHAGKKFFSWEILWAGKRQPETQQSSCIPWHRAVLPWHSSRLLRTVTQPDRKAEEKQEVPIPTRIWGQHHSSRHSQGRNTHTMKSQAPVAGSCLTLSCILDYLPNGFYVSAWNLSPERSTASLKALKWTGRSSLVIVDPVIIWQ